MSSTHFFWLMLLLKNTDSPANLPIVIEKTRYFFSLPLYNLTLLSIVFFFHLLHLSPILSCFLPLLSDCTKQRLTIARKEDHTKEHFYELDVKVSAKMQNRRQPCLGSECHLPSRTMADLVFNKRHASESCNEVIS